MVPRMRIGAIVAFVAGVLADPAAADPVREIPGLQSITFWERTGGLAPTAYTFAVNSSQLTGKLADPLGSGNFDIQGVPGVEFYDVFYSDEDGVFDPDGEYLTITGVFPRALPAGGGLNLAEIGLNFSGSAPTEFGNFVASFVALGDNASPDDVGNAIDGDLLTHTTMGNTLGQADRLRVTLGFLSSSGPAPDPVPEPSTVVLMCVALGLATLRGLPGARRVSDGAA
jgi:hypothetical protein